MGFCASRGWSMPDEDTLRKYLSNWSPKHHLEIGLLHPCLTAYHNLPRVQEKINRLIEECHLGMGKLNDPQAPDREFVLKAPELLGYTQCADVPT